MNTEVSKYIDEHLNEMLSDLSKLVSINSVKGDPQEDAPFGEGPRKVLDEAMKIAQRHKFTTRLVNNVMLEVPKRVAICIVKKVSINYRFLSLILECLNS